MCSEHYIWFLCNDVLKLFFIHFNLSCYTILVVTVIFRRDRWGPSWRSNCRVRPTWLRFFSFLNLFNLSNIFLIPSWDVIWLNYKNLETFNLLLFFFFLRLHRFLLVINNYVNVLNFLLNLVILLLTLWLLPYHVISIPWDLAHKLIGHDLFIGNGLPQVISFVMRRGTW